MTDSKYEKITTALLTWYAAEKRDLPWRRNKIPYRIWISEVMLQQTQIATAIPYYERFLDVFPDVESLARASLEQVLKAWENLGYYSRARNLHKAAKIIMDRHNGRFPDRYSDVKALPGIGEYIAGAVCSIAFNEPVPAIDGNVRRVASRLFAISDPVNERKAQLEIADIMAKLVPADNPGDFNQAVMDLGAVICTPKKPSCPSCPARAFCSALQENLQNILPVKTRRTKIPHHQMAAAVIKNDSGEYLVVQRPENGFLGGLWMWPGGRIRDRQDAANELRRLINKDYGLEINVLTRIDSINHQYSHFKITLHPFICELRPAADQRPAVSDGAESKWITYDVLQDLAFSNADRQVIEKAFSQGGLKTSQGG